MIGTMATKISVLINKPPQHTYGILVLWKLKNNNKKSKTNKQKTITNFKVFNKIYNISINA